MIIVEFEDPCTGIAEVDRDRIKTICNRVDVELHALLPTLADTVHLNVNIGNHVIPDVGHSASALTLDSIAFTLAANRPGDHGRIIEASLRPTLFHECHHLVRGWVKRGGQRRQYFIEGVICEGLASAFERDAVGHALPWSDYPADVCKWVDELLPLPADAPYAQWMFHHPDGRRWIGYRAGCFIADRAMAASGHSAAELAKTDYAEILKLVDLPWPPRQTRRRWFTH